jgi:uronate dehydrogenase
VGTYNVFEAARWAGVERVVYASSSHVVGFYERSRQVGPDDPMRPHTMYAVTKGAGELVARLYHDKYGLDVVTVRIGSLRHTPEDARHLSTWLSGRDAVDLFRRCVEAPVSGHQIVFGVSAVRASWWRNPVAKTLGYVPRDTPALERPSADDVMDAEEGQSKLFQGGRFTDPDYRGGLGRPRSN